jgi:uncharacterized protein (TIGR00369 family)
MTTLDSSVADRVPEGFSAADTAVVLDEFNTSLGLRFLEIGPDRVVGTLPVEGNRQSFGLLHGGANGALAETLGSVAAVFHAGPERFAGGLELSCTHHRAVRAGVVTGVCTPLHIGRTTATFDIVISDDKGRRTCTARLTCLLREPAEPKNS